MPAKRKYSDAQRDALWRLHEAGLTSAELADAAKSGGTGLAPFTIPDRTARAIIKEMSKEAVRSLPMTVVELESVEAMERVPARAARIVDAELGRLEGKQGKRGLTDQEIDRLPRLAAHSARIAKLLQGQGGQQSRGRTASDGARGRPQPESALEKLAREQGEQISAKDQPLLTRTRQLDDDSSPKGDQAALNLTAATEVALARRRRADAARKARAALAPDA